MISANKATGAVFLLAFAAATLVACGGDDEKLPPSGSGGSGAAGTGGASGGSGGVAGAAGAAGAGGTAGAGGSGGTGATGATGGSGGLPVIDEPDTACTDATAKGNTAYAPNA